MFAGDRGYASRSMWQPNSSQWWMLAMFSVLIVAAWPPGDDKSLAAKFVNWAVDPTNELPTLPDQLALGRATIPTRSTHTTSRCSSTTRCISKAAGRECDSN